MALDTNHLKTLQDILGADILKKVRASYLEDSAPKIERLGEAIAQQDFTNVNTLSHSLKSASANLAMLELADIFAQLEAQASQEQNTNMTELYQAAVAEYQLAVSELNTAF